MTSIASLVGNGEADALGAAGFGKNGGIDAQQIAMGIHQRAAGVARVDRGIGLDKVFVGVDAQAGCGRWR